ncbi:MAG: heavy metal translocating P-type ATPase metal-binding domain-containing protein, partial [Bacteroidia bacterium]
MNPSQAISQSCYHCGNHVSDRSFDIKDKHFCCGGCKMVYEILNENELCTYYELNTKPGLIQNKSKRKDKYAFLEDLEIQRKLIRFSDKTQSHIVFYLPQIHCSSCLWLLENIDKVNPGIISSTVNFSKKEVFLVFDNSQTSLRKVVETLDGIGYEPYLSLNELSSTSKLKTDRTRWYKIGVAGFCFGNIMMMSLADYFAFSGAIEPKLEWFFRIISILLSLPVLFYSATEFFVSAWRGL